MIKLLACLVASVWVFAGAMPLNEDILQDIKARYLEADSDSMLIIQDDEVVLELGNTDEIIETMSITKGILNLATGILIKQGMLESIDTPVYHFIPEWDVPIKREVTLRHLLTHTSGLEPFKSVEEGYLVPDFVASAIQSEIIEPPGSHFFYNNKGTNLYAGILERIAGERLDIFVERNLFVPLGIDEFYWNLDFAGHAMGMCGLELNAKSLATIGQFVLNRGEWNGERIIDEEWFDESLKQAQPFNHTCGLLWWLDREKCATWPEELLSQYRQGGVSQHYITKLRDVGPEGIVIHDRNLKQLFGSRARADAFFDEIDERGLKRFDLHLGEVRGYRIDGYLGQYLLIVPAYNLVAVRQSRYGKKPDDQYDYFKDFIPLVHALIDDRIPSGS